MILCPNIPEVSEFESLFFFQSLGSEFFQKYLFAWYICIVITS